jgi:hypothetical protein
MNAVKQPTAIEPFRAAHPRDDCVREGRQRTDEHSCNAGKPQYAEHLRVNHWSFGDTKDRAAVLLGDVTVVTCRHARVQFGRQRGVSCVVRAARSIGLQPPKRDVLPIRRPDP